jgi:hypothetical protein
MMKIKYYIPYAIGISFLFGVFLMLKTLDITTYKATVFDGGASPKTPEAYEFMMLRDPATGKIPNGIRHGELEFAQTLPGSLQYLKNHPNNTLTTDWKRNGPINVGGRTRALAIDKLNENIILAGGVSGGLWRSIDGGKNWTRTTKQDQLSTISCIVQDKRAGKENIWYAGTGEFWGNSAGIYGDGIYKSTDNGLSWNLLKSTMTNNPQSWDNAFEFVWNIVINPKAASDKDEILAATAFGGIYRSSDGGNTWKAVLGGFGNSNSFFTDIAVTSDGIFYATLSQITFESKSSVVKGIFRSADGVKWVDISPSDIPLKYDRIAIGIAPSDENQLYFIAESPGYGKLTRNMQGDSLWHSFWKYTYKSGDGTLAGGFWENRSDFLPKPENIRGQMNSQGSYDLVIKVKPDDPNVVFLGGTVLYRSNDGFSSNNFSWIGGYLPYKVADNVDPYRYPNHHADQHAIVFLPSNPNVMFSGTDGGVTKTLNNIADNVEWVDLNNGYYTTQFYTCAIDHATQGSNEIIGGLQDNGTLYTNSNDVNKAWTNPTYADGLSCLIADGGKTYYSSNNTSTSPVAVSIWRFTLDANGLRTYRTRIDPAGGRDFMWNCPIKLDPNDNKRMYVGGGKLVWRNNDLTGIPDVESKDSTTINWDSLSFTRIDTTTNKIVKRPGVISAMDISKNPANVLYYGTTYGEVFRIDNAKDGDPKPVNITGTIMPRDAFASCIKIDPSDANKVFVVFSNYNVLSIFYSTNAGLNWTPVSGNLEENHTGSGRGPACLWLNILPVGGKNIYLAGTSTGLYSTASLDGLYTVWQQEGAETIGNTVVKMVDVRESDGFVAVATHGNGVFTANIKDFPAPPLAPVLVFPANNSNGVQNSQLFEWQAVTDAVSYKIEISKSSDFQTIDFEKDGLGKTSCMSSIFEDGMNDYYWRVLARNAGGRSEYSQVWKLTSIISYPSLTYPSNGKDSIPLDVKLTWDNSKGAVSYHLQVSPSLLFNSFVADTIINTNEFNLKGLQNKSRYYWKVLASDGTFSSIYSPVWSFRTIGITSVRDKDIQYSQNSGYLKLEQNYPNPVNNFTKIDFYLGINTNCKLKLVDNQGNDVRILLKKYLNSGNYSYNFDLSAYPTGKYFYVLEAGGHREVKSLIINR